MIDLASLRPADVGRAVVYRPAVGAAEDGVIVSWNERYVFVRYGVQNSSKATDPRDLTFLRDARPA